MEDVKTILSQLTLEEKASLASGKTFWTTKPIERLGVPSALMTDGPHGLRKEQGAEEEKGLTNVMKGSEKVSSFQKSGPSVKSLMILVFITCSMPDASAQGKLHLADVGQVIKGSGERVAALGEMEAYQVVDRLAEEGGAGNSPNAHLPCQLLAEEQVVIIAILRNVQ